MPALQFDSTERLLLAAATVRSDDQASPPLDALESDIDWTRLVRLAKTHSLAPLLASGLAGCDLGDAGRRARDELAQAARRSLCRNLLLAGELPALLDRFDTAAIPALVFKGPTLAVVAYGSLAPRPFDDLDIVVRTRDFERAKQILHEAGLTPSADEFAAVRHLSNEQAFEARGGRLQVDLHGRLFPRELFAVDFERLLARAVRVRVGEREVPALCREDLLIVVCEHAHKHFWVRLLWLADIARLAGAELDWAAVEDLSRASGSRRVLGIGLLLATELLGASVPGEVVERARTDRSTAELARDVAGRLFAPLSPARADRELVRLQWRSRHRWRDRLRYLWTPNESDWLMRPLPSRWELVYHFARPLRLLVKYGPWSDRRGDAERGSAAGAGQRDAP